MNSNKSIFSLTPSGKSGAIILALVSVVLAIVVVLNLLLGILPDAFTVFDTSSVQMLAISDVSKEFVSNIKDDVTIYYLCENSEKDYRIGAFLDKYEAMSDHINLEVIDPVEHPTFALQYTDKLLSNGSLIVASEKRAEAIDVNDLYYWENLILGRMSYDQLRIYESSEEYLYYLTELGVSEFFNGESVLSRAIEYVLADSIPTAYFITGHDEEPHSEYLLEYLGVYDIQYATLDKEALSTKIPDNATCLIISDPDNDISATEKSVIESYLRDGGNLFLATDPKNVESLQNLTSLLSSYGVSTDSSIVYEGNSDSHTPDAQYQIFAQVHKDHNATSEVAGYEYDIYFPESGAIRLNAPSIPEGVNITKIFTTTNTAFLKGSPDDKHTFNLGVAISDKIDDNTEAKIVWLASSSVLTDEAAIKTSGGNYLYYIHSLRWMCDSFDSVLPEISGINIDEQYLEVPDIAAHIFFIVLVVLIPVGVAAVGIIKISVRRRR